MTRVPVVNDDLDLAGHGLLPSQPPATGSAEPVMSATGPRGTDPVRSLPAVNPDATSGPGPEPSLAARMARADMRDAFQTGAPPFDAATRAAAPPECLSDPGTKPSRARHAGVRRLMPASGRSRLTPRVTLQIIDWRDPEFVIAVEEQLARLVAEVDPQDWSTAPALLQSNLREAGYPSAIIEVERSAQDVLSGHEDWTVRRDDLPEDR